VSVSSSDQGFSFSDVVKNDIFRSCLLLSFNSFRYNRNLSMKNTEYRMIMRLVYFFAWLCSRDEKKLRTSRNKISMQIPVTGARCTIVWAILVLIIKP
jgi:hypothetical protein